MAGLSKTILKDTIGAEALVWQKCDQIDIQGHSKQKATIGIGHNNYVYKI